VFDGDQAHGALRADSTRKYAKCMES
jgi:hypothetical protein